MYGPNRSDWDTSRRSSTDRAKRSSADMAYFGGSDAAGQPSRGHARTGSHGGAGRRHDTPELENYRDKTNKIISSFFWKAAIVIVRSRVDVESSLDGARAVRTNVWFGTEMDEMETFRPEMQIWRLCDVWNDPRPLPPLIIETFLDTSDIPALRALVICDDRGKRWNVTEALESAANRAGYIGLRKGESGYHQQVVLERWRVELSPGAELPSNLDLRGTVYRKATALFRALYTFVMLMPTWQFRKRLQKPKLHTSPLKIGCRVLSGDDLDRRGQDGLGLSFDGDKDVLEAFDFGKVETAAGALRVSVQYRKNVEFRVDDSETYLSSQFAHLDERHGSRSPGIHQHQRTSSQPSAYATARGSEQGSLPSVAHPVYGSLSSYHAERMGNASPISALRTAAEMADRASNESSERLPSGSVHSRASLRSRDGGVQLPSRRGSINFMQPFKSPSLSNSPANDYPISSLGRHPPGPGSLNPNRLSGGSPASFKSASSRFAPQEPETAAPQISSSFTRPGPQPTARITSSFGTRRPRVASTTRNADDDASSSGQASYSSSAPRSSHINSLPAASLEDDKQIQEFMNLLADGQKTSLKSFTKSSTTADRNPGNLLSKYQKMRESQAALADSISSSLLLQQPQSPTASSRALSNVPGMVPSTFSSSSSPGKPISPHTPHTPAVPSRLSEGSVARYDNRPERRHRPSPTQEEPPAPTAATTSPLDIPTSPRFMGPRRANSMSHREDSSIDYSPSYDARRQSTSLNSADPDSVPVPISRLLSEAQSTALPRPRENTAAAPPDDDDDDVPPIPPMSLDEPAANRFTRATAAPRNRFEGRRSSASYEKDPSNSAGSRPGIGDRRGNSWSRASGAQAEDDELLFAMSDMSYHVAQQGRRSLDRRESRGGAQ